MHQDVVVRTGDHPAEQMAFALAGKLVLAGKIVCPPAVSVDDYRSALDHWLRKALRDAKSCGRCLADDARRSSEEIGPLPSSPT